MVNPTENEISPLINRIMKIARKGIIGKIVKTGNSMDHPKIGEFSLPFVDNKYCVIDNFLF